MRLPRRRLLLVALPLALAAGAALAAQPNGRRPANAVINACVKKKDGRVRIVAATASCRRNELPLAWNAQGRPGRPGLQVGSGPLGRPVHRDPPERPGRRAMQASVAQPERQAPPAAPGRPGRKDRPAPF